MRPTLALGCLSIALTLTLSACQRSVFALPPGNAEVRCEAPLQGGWHSIAEPNSTDSLSIHINASCQISGEVHQGDRMQTLEPTRLGVLRWKESNYLWFDAGWANRNFAVETGPLDDGEGVYVYRYRIDNDRLVLDPPTTRTLAKAIASGEVEGDLYKHGEDWTVRVRGNRANNRKALQLAMADSQDPLILQRSATEEASHD